MMSSSDRQRIVEIFRMAASLEHSMIDEQTRRDWLTATRAGLAPESKAVFDHFWRPWLHAVGLRGCDTNALSESALRDVLFSDV